MMKDINCNNIGKDALEPKVELDQHVKCFLKLDFSQNIFETLERGRYYIKIEVDWINDTYFNKGAICIYTKK